MDELRAVEKSISELKTIQNRLKKILKKREWPLTHEIPRLETIIKDKEDEITSLQMELQEYKSELESKLIQLEKMKSLLDKTKADMQQLEEENEKLRSNIKELKSDYLYRSLTAKTHFYEERIKQLKEKMSIQEKVRLGNFRNFDIMVDQYTKSLLLEIATLEKRNITLERTNDELLKENIHLRKS